MTVPSVADFMLKKLIKPLVLVLIRTLTPKTVVRTNFLNNCTLTSDFLTQSM